MQRNKIKIIYIAGSSRSGSTILGKYLGQYIQFFHVGEMRYVWEKNIRDSLVCECGEPLLECKFWKNVIDNAFGNIEDINIDEMISFCHWVGSNKRVVRLFRYNKKRYLQNFSSNSKVMERFYEYAYKYSNAEFIVDGSKYPMYGFMLSLLPNTEVYMIHLVRDPRAVAFSWTRKKIFNPVSKREMPRKSIFQGTFMWIKNNLIVEFVKLFYFKNSLFVKYEEFSSYPELCITNILNWLTKLTNDTTTLSGYREDQHSTSGNPVRYDKGEIIIKPDFEWKGKLSLKQKILVTLLSLPLLILYKYPVAIKKL